MRLRIFLAFALIVVTTVVSVMFFARVQMAREVRAFAFRGGLIGLEDLVNGLEGYYQANHTWRGVEGFFRGPIHGPGMGPPQGLAYGQRLRLADTQGNVLVDTGQPPGNLPSRLTLAEQEAAILLFDNHTLIGYLLPEGGTPRLLEIETALLRRLNLAGWNAALLSAGLSLLLAFLLAYTLLRPVRELTQAASHLAKGDLSQRVPVRGRDELALLAQTFNQMAASLEQAETNRKAMTADIAHELRNPLAVVRANIEALQDGIYPLSPENLEPLLAQTDLLSRLVEDVRMLALADTGQLRLHFVPGDLAALARRALEPFEAQAAARAITLEFIEDTPCPPLLLDPGRVGQILHNLLSNALRHTPDGGRVTLGVRCDPGEAHLTLRDTGPGIPESSLPRLFERFYRADRSRSREEGGTGLGLAIARQFAEAHGGSLTAANHPAGGAVFTLVLPVGAEGP